MGIDATRKLPEEGFTREWPDVIEMDDATKRRVDAMWPTLGIGLARRRRCAARPRAPSTRAKGRRSRIAGRARSSYVNFVKLPHTLFALPFALVGVVLASYRAPVTWALARLGRARVHLRPIRGDGLQSHRRP